MLPLLIATQDSTKTEKSLKVAPLITSSPLMGFGAGSEYSWKFNLLVGYDVSKTIALIAGYQGYGVEYREDDISFQYDIFTGGGVFGINFHF